MGRRRRKIVRITKKRLPNVFLCPKCGYKKLKVETSNNGKKGKIRCSGCGLSRDVVIKKSYEEIDVYCNFVDNFNE